MSSFQSVIVDCHQFNWASIVTKYKGNLDVHKEIFSAAISICNSHLFSSLNNRLVVIAAGGVKLKKWTYEANQNDTSNFTDSLERFFHDALGKTDSEEAAPSHYSAAMSYSICAFQKFNKQFPGSTGNIVIINLADTLSEQNILMNLFFASRHNSLTVNVASLNGAIPILQQACDVTGGIHVLVDNPKLLTQTLLGNLSLSDCQNPVFKRQPGDIDYKAVCHCHNQLISIGWVCSVCLSVTCNFVPFCKICNAMFPRPISNQQKHANKKAKQNNGRQ